MSRLSDYVDQSVSEPPATINLEVWASPDYDTFAKELVKEVGSVGPPGRFGWFIPGELDFPVKEYYNKYIWEKSIQEVHWSFFMDRNLVHYFDMDNDMLQMIEDNSFNKDPSQDDEYVCLMPPCVKSMYTPKQCENTPCAILLAPQYNSTKFLIKQVDETGLLVKILWLGDNFQSALNEIKGIHLLENVHHNKPKKSVVFFHWFPSEVVTNENHFISVQFKNNELYNFTRGINGSGYKYEMQRLVKLAWSKIENNAQPLYIALRHFKLTEDDYLHLLRMYEKSEQSVPEIACTWMKENQQVWNSWKHGTQKAVIYIGGIFPMSASSYNGGGIARGAMIAAQAVNNNHTLLNDYELKLLVSDGKCQTDSVMKNFIDFIVTREYYNNLVGVLGPACSETVEPIAGVSKFYHILIISYSAEGASFSNRKKYPYFFRTIGENQHYKHVYLALFQRFGWKRVAALTEDGQKYTEYISLMSDDLEKDGIKFIANKKFPRDKSSEDMKYYLADLKNRRARIIIADVIENVARTVMCEAYKQEMTAKEGYVWFLPIWLDPNWYDTDAHNNNSSEVVNCTTKEMIEAIAGYFSMTHAYFAKDDSIMQENITVGEWRKKNDLRIKNANYAGFAYDAVWTYALALNELVNTDPEALSVLHSESTTNKLVRIVEKTDFDGVSGRIKFRGGPSRFSFITIVQWYNNKTNTIGHFYPNLTEYEPEILGGELKLNETLLKWFTSDGNIPKDGTLPPPSCAVDGLARAFNVECQTAWIILNIIIAILFIMSVMGACYYMKRKYDLKVEKTKNYMRSLGIPFNLTSASDLDKWEIHRESVVINRKLGEGAFGTVYGGEADLPSTGWTAVAVKTLKMGSTTEEKLDFLSEAEAMKRFDHKNIVKLLGVCTKEEPVYTIMEFMLYGDLKTYLLARRHLVKNKNIEEYEEISPKRLTNMALDVARGLSYLAEIKFVHRDIASRNCLVNAQRTVKIGDFGMTRAMFENDYYKFTRRGMLPVRWMSPESLALGVFTPASDVWSFGVLLYEIITFGSFPFQGKSNTQVLEIVKEGQTLEIPRGIKPQLDGLIRSCWKREAKERPTASQMVEFLANNPRLLTPCLEGPISSLQIGDSDQLEMVLKDTKVSPTKSTSSTTFRSPSSVFANKNESDIIPMEICSPKQPLLGPRRSSSPNIISKLVVGSERESEDDDDEYLDQNSSGRQDNTNV
nr:receptor-type guanylate cyclase gcy-18-like [Leptinotarsa decemlineata]